MVRPGRSPLTSELLAPDEELSEVLDYEDVEENEASMPDPEITQAVAHIPEADAFADIEMQESRPPPGLNPRSAGWGMMLTWSDRTPLNWDRHPQLWQRKQNVGRSNLQDTGWPGANEDPGRTEDD